MEEKQELKVHGSFVGVLRKEDGTVTTTRKDNMILDCGYDFIADAIGNSNATRPNAMDSIAVGTSAMAVSAQQTSLYSRLMTKKATYQHVQGAKVFSISTKFGEGEATGAICEACVCGSAGLLDRIVFPVVNKGENDTYEVTFTFTMS